MRGEDGLRLDDDAVRELCSRFGLDQDALSPLQGERNLVVVGVLAGNEVVLKIIPSGESERRFLLGEVDWVAHLHANGVGVPRLLPSRRDDLVETVEYDGYTCNAYCYERVAGPLWHEVTDKAEHIAAVGQLAGKIHAVSAGYVPTIEGACRPRWSDAPWFASPAETIHASMPGVIERCLLLRQAIESLPSGDWGIVHNDLHGGNVVITSQGPVAIDFECSEYSRLVSEIGSGLYFWLWKTPESDPQHQAQQAAGFLRAFMAGYAREYSLGAGWTGALPLFLKARELSIFASSGLEGQDFRTQGAHDRTFAWMKDNIENAVPYVDVDFASVELS